MKLKIISRDSDVQLETERLAERRVRAAFEPFSHWVRDVVVRLAGEGGLRGGVRKRVTLDLVCEGVGPMRFEAQAQSHPHGLAEVIKRAKRSMLASPRLGSRSAVRGSGRAAAGWAGGS